MATTYRFSTATIVVFYISAFICGMAVGLAVTGNESALVALLLVLSTLLLSGFLFHTSRFETTSGASPGQGDSQ